MKLPNVIGICGQMGSGKDTAAKWFTDRGYARSGFSDPIKSALNSAFGWTMHDWENREWKEGGNIYAYRPYGVSHSKASPRSLAQWLGTEVVRNNFGENAWIDVWTRRWHDLGQPRTVIADVRFQNEISAIHKLGGIIIRIVRKGDRSGELFFDQAGDPAHIPHDSERTAELRDVDHEISNDGSVADLYAELERRFS